MRNDNFYNSIINNQLQKKLLLKSSNDNLSLKTIDFSLNIQENTKSSIDTLLLESLFILELIIGKKAVIKSLKEKYTSVSSYLGLTVRSKLDIYYFLLLLNKFYLPILYRRKSYFKNSFDSLGNYDLSNLKLNFLMNLPDIYYY
jgi:hypothetical protein